MKHSSTNFSLSRTDWPRRPSEQSNCARKRADIYRAAFAVALVAFVTACDRHEPSAQLNSNEEVAASTPKEREADSLPNIQDEFEGLRGKLRLPYSNAKNEIVKSSIFNAANKKVDDFFSTNGTYAKNWNGEIKTLSTSHGGKDAWLVVRGVDGTTYRMSDIDSNSELYRELALLQEGEHVIFSGSFQKAASGLWDISFTERGSLEAPEYRFIFETVRYLDGNSPRPSIERLQITAPKIAEASVQQQYEPSPDLGALAQEVLDVDPVGVALRTSASIHQSNGFRGTCNLLAGMLSMTVQEREHGITLKKSQQNIARVLEGMEVNENDIGTWQAAATLIHATQVSEKQLEIVAKRCEQIPTH